MLRRWMKLGVLVLLLVPLSVVTTLLLFPFWSWFEKATGIESMGHSGPAGWCYLAVLGLMAAACAAVALVRRTGR